MLNISNIFTFFIRYFLILDAIIEIIEQNDTHMVFFHNKYVLLKINQLYFLKVTHLPGDDNFERKK